MKLNENDVIVRALLQYIHLRKGDLIAQVNKWEFGYDGKTEFERAVKSGLIVHNKYDMWELASRPFVMTE